ncbi:hypothetical protein ACN38_g7130 [Penicillium nordicum]|uniref:Uncharacterized protein n=1 Tax=Penicillium nordicum TaxID=229535 RepID=A0A0M9WEM7_9EURO|nr:hypothetical protein ACN38_g7130 [Penicillium nordicum]
MYVYEYRRGLSGTRTIICGPSPVIRDSQPMQKPHGSTKIVRVTWVRGAHCPKLPPVTLTPVTCIIFIKAKVRTHS